MIYLWLSILSSTGIYFLFKIRNKMKADLHGIIVVNYFVATLLGLLNQDINKITSVLQQAAWLPIAVIIGFLFVVMFFLIGNSTHKAGIVITTLATRMSMVFPIFFSMFLFDEDVTVIRLIKIAITLIAVVMAIYRKPDKSIKRIAVIIPFVLFVGSGSVDTLVKAAQHLFVPDNEISIFSSVLFATSFIGALLALFIKKPVKNSISLQTLIIGVALGFANWGSLFFIMKALNHSQMDSSLVFGVNNLAIVSCSLILGYIVFKEKLSRLNWLGIFLSIISIILLIRY
jgi:drug/metabolite transporter (DMT)-like permease